MFSKKSHNAINAITIVAACGVAIISIALICTLSVYNGFEALVGDLYSNIDPDLRIEASVGKTFPYTESLASDIKSTPGVDLLTPSLEETVLISYSGRQIPATMKGVDSTFQQTCRIDSILLGGDFLLSDPICNYGIFGAGLAARLNIGAGFLRPCTVYCPRREGKVSMIRLDQAFREDMLFCSGVFAVNQADYDDNIVIVPINFARCLLGDTLLTTAIEVKLTPGVKTSEVQKALCAKLGADYKILNRTEQQADQYKIVQIEKWITFFIIIFILLIASFNVIGALSMLIIDKEEEITTLRNLGANNGLIQRIFLFEGWLISGSGALVGILIGITLCLLQERYGFIGLGDGSAMFVVDSYPVRLHACDVLLSVVCVLAIGILAAIYPLRALKGKLPEDLS